jgi:hypothetical protein
VYPTKEHEQRSKNVSGHDNDEQDPCPHRNLMHRNAQGFSKTMIVTIIIREALMVCEDMLTHNSFAIGLPLG